MSASGANQACSPLKFWLGTHRPNWLALEPDIFVSRRTLTGRKTFPIAAGEWALDSEVERDA